MFMLMPSLAQYDSEFFLGTWLKYDSIFARQVISC